MSFSRRTFVKSGAACATQCAIPKMNWAQAISDTEIAGRQVFSVNQHSLFSRTFDIGMVEQIFGDSTFEGVTLPHANVRVPWHSFQESLYLFVSVYRRALHLPQDLHVKGCLFILKA